MDILRCFVCFIVFVMNVWYRPTMHKVLIHGPTIVKYAILPIGQLSEEAAEARNKHFRLYRLNYARKFSRKQCNRDVLNRLLLTSDPYLSSSRRMPTRRRKPFSKEALDLLLPANPTVVLHSGRPTEDSATVEDVRDSEDDDFE
jgi:hypothetical protein